MNYDDFKQVLDDTLFTNAPEDSGCFLWNSVG